MDYCSVFHILQSLWAHLHVVGMLQFISDINQPSLPTPFYSLLVSISVFKALSTVFQFINSPDNSPLSHSVPSVLPLPLLVLSTIYVPIHESLHVPLGSSSRGGHITVYVYGINQPSLPTPFYSLLVSISVIMALSTVFHSINSPNNSPFSHSVLVVLALPYWFFQLYISL